MVDLSKRQEYIVQQVRTQVSAIVAGWIQSKFQAGKTVEDVWISFEEIHAIFRSSSKVSDHEDIQAEIRASDDGMTQPKEVA